VRYFPAVARLQSEKDGTLVFVKSMDVKPGLRERRADFGNYQTGGTCDVEPAHRQVIRMNLKTEKLKD